MRCPKPETRLERRTHRDRTGRQREAALKRAVWDRDEGRCRVCGVRCLRLLTLHPRRGEVHHGRPRAHRATRFDVRNGLLLCAADHERVTTHRIEIVAKHRFVIEGVAYFDMSGPLHFVHAPGVES